MVAVQLSVNCVKLKTDNERKTNYSLTQKKKKEEKKGCTDITILVDTNNYFHGTADDQ